LIRIWFDFDGFVIIGELPDTFGSASRLMKNLNEPVCCTPRRNWRLILAPGASGVPNVIVPADILLL
jgi:hypothetical protein